VKFPNKVLSWDGDAQRIPTQENQFIWVDTTARWRIADPQLFYESSSNVNQAQSRLDAIIDSEVRKVIANNPLREAVRASNIINEIERTNVFATSSSEGGGVDIEQIVGAYTEQRFEEIYDGRAILASAIKLAARKLTPQFGIELIDVIIRQIRYSDELTRSVYARMIAERNQIAQAFRSDGEGERVRWLGARERELALILSEARRQGEEIKGFADAEASAIYASAYGGRNEGFYEFWRSMESYKTLLPTFTKTFSTDSDFFKYLYNPEGN
jgi:membrane protease subunit HflC